LKLGFDIRTEKRTQQIIKYQKSKLEEKEHHQRIIDDIKSNIQVDYNFKDIHQQTAIEKLRLASIHYNKYQHGLPNQLNYFEGASLTPAEFYDALKRTFNVHLSKKELGALIRIFDVNGAGSIPCADFIIQFLKLGFEERSKINTLRLQKIQTTEEKNVTSPNSTSNLNPKEINANNIEINFNFTHEDLQRAVQKIAIAARDYNPTSPSAFSLHAFEAATMSPSMFREMLKRCLNISLTNKELSALMTIFDKTGETT